MCPAVLPRSTPPSARRSHQCVHMPWRLATVHVVNQSNGVVAQCMLTGLVTVRTRFHLSSAALRPHTTCIHNLSTTKKSQHKVNCQFKFEGSISQSKFCLRHPTHAPTVLDGTHTTGSHDMPTATHIAAQQTPASQQQPTTRFAACVCVCFEWRRGLSIATQGCFERPVNTLLSSTILSVVQLAPRRTSLCDNCQSKRTSYVGRWMDEWMGGG
jgi:hypothetical protein